MPFLSKILFPLFICLYVNGFSQTKIIDSIRRNLSTAQNNEQKIKALLDICAQRYSLTANSLYQYASDLKQISSKKSDYKNVTLADFYIAYSLLINGMEDSSLKIANNYLQKMKGDAAEIDAYKLFLQLKGTICYRTNRSKETLNAYYDLLNEAQRTNDTLSILIAKRGISLSYIVNGQDREGLKIFYSAEEMLPQKIPEKYIEIHGLLQANASISFLHLHQNTGLAIYADSCEYYGAKAVEIGKETQNLFMECQGLIVRGLILSYQKKMAEAEKSLQDGLEVRKVIGDTIYIISDMSVLGSFYANTKQLEKGVAICNTGIALAQKRKISPALLLLLYNALAENYRAAGHYKEYAEALQSQIAVKDSLNIKNSTDELKDLEIKYDLQKQENTIIQQKLNITKKNYWLYGSVLFTVMAIIIFWLIFRNYHRRQQVKMRIALEEEKRIAAQSVIDAEEQERKRIATDLHDNLGVYAASLSSNLNYLQPGYSDGKTENALRELKNNSNSIISELNDTIWVLKKDALSLTAISDRIKIFINRIRNSYPDINIEVKEKIETDFKLPSSQAFHLYRILQEAITNALKHSKGKNVSVEIIAGINWKIIIEDDGIGIKENASSSGNGLMHMKERSNEAGWVINLLNKTGGTAIEVYPTTN